MLIYVVIFRGKDGVDVYQTQVLALTATLALNGVRMRFTIGQMGIMFPVGYEMSSKPLISL